MYKRIKTMDRHNKHIAYRPRFIITGTIPLPATGNTTAPYKGTTGKNV
jgi:hypothetical protein